jgi:hypothetical protein
MILFETKGITSWLTFAVNSVRISNDIPVQSEYLPLITLYMLMSMIYTLFAFVWFIIADHLSKTKKIPFIFKLVADTLRKCRPLNYRKVEQKKKIIKPIETTSIKTVEQESYQVSTLNSANEVGAEQDIRLNENKILDSNRNQCYKCNSDIVNAEKSKSENEKHEKESQVKTLNLLAFSLIFLFIFSCNLTIWLKIGS